MQAPRSVWMTDVLPSRASPAPTRDWWCLCSHAIVQTTRMPLTEGRAQVLLWGGRGRTPRQPRWSGRPAGLFECRICDRHISLWEPGLPAMQAPRSIWRNKVLASRAGPLPQELVLVKIFAFAFAFVVATRLCRRRECPSQKAERRSFYGGGAAGRRASRDGPWMARGGVPTEQSRSEGT